MKRFFCLAILSALVLTGCSSKEETVYSPEPIGEHDRCKLCGMVISHYEGPKGEVFLKDAKNAIKFCSLRDSFTFALQPENARRLKAYYVNVMGKTTWENAIKAPMVDATRLIYVYGSKQEGAMGVEPIGFVTQEEAQRFQTQEGGRILKYNEVTLSVLAE